jgi:flavorubredoxin/NADPH-dependent 2,4-dienoyl-CoA reductase/sulfur reductase-like enzyme/rubredoxin
MSALQVRDNLYWVGALDPDLRVFDVVMYTDYGTSYNSYILKTDEGNILFETAKMKFFDEFIENVTEICPLDSIRYIVVDHTEPDHVGSLEKLLDYCPKAEVLASQVALNFLTEICNREIPGIAVGDGDKITLGGETLSFVNVPFLHWPDSIYTYIESHKALITCDSFGCHYSDPKVFNDQIEGKFVDAYKYYFDMIMGPFKSHVQYALEQIKQFDIETICPGHGPVLRENLDFYLDLYNKWSYEEAPAPRSKPLVINSFVSAYGYTEELAREINHGVSEIVDCDIKLYDMVHADYDQVAAEVASADGLLFGTPTVNGDALPPVSTLVAGLNGILHGGKVAASYGSYGWSGEGPDMLTARLNLLRMDTLEPALKINFKPSEENREMARAYGRRFGKKVKESWEKIGISSGGKTLWKCTVCGEVFEGALPPINCPICGVGSEAFIEYEEDVVNHSSTEALSYAIIGSGAAAVSAAEAIRKRNSECTINIYTAESSMPYYRPILTEMISEQIGDEQFFIKNESFYSDNNIVINLNSPVAEIQRKEKTITLESGETVAYDKLLLATGASPFVPPIKGKDLPGVFTMRTDSDLGSLQAALKKESTKEVTVVGGGLLGLEAACSLAKLDCKVTVVDTAPTILPRQTDASGSELFHKIVKSSNIDIITNTVVQEIYGNSDTNVQGVILANGTDLKSDLVLISAGLSPNIELAQKAGLECNRAVIVDSSLRTSDVHIFAAGDCAITDGTYYGVWEPALNQGRVAGANMAGDEAEFNGKQYPATLNAFNTSLFALGNLHNSGEEDGAEKIIAVDELCGNYSALYFTEGKLDGALMIGDISKAAPIISGINNRMDLQECIDAKILS